MSDGVSEPLVAYGLNPQYLDSEIEVINYARNGVHTQMLWDFLKGINSSKADFEELLPYSLKTFNRKTILDEAMGERVLNIIRVFKKGEELFNNIETFKKWLHKFNPVLGDQPIHFLNTSTGCQIVIDELGRAQHGIMG